MQNIFSQFHQLFIGSFIKWKSQKICQNVGDIYSYSNFHQHFKSSFSADFLRQKSIKPNLKYKIATPACTKKVPIKYCWNWHLKISNDLRKNNLRKQTKNNFCNRKVWQKQLLHEKSPKPKILSPVEQHRDIQPVVCVPIRNGKWFNKF